MHVTYKQVSPNPERTFEELPVGTLFQQPDRLGLYLKVERITFVSGDKNAVIVVPRQAVYSSGELVNFFPSSVVVPIAGLTISTYLNVPPADQED